MIDCLITSKTRIKILLRFFLNSQTTGYLRNLENEFGESTNSIRVELNKLEDAGFLKSSIEGNKKLFYANTSHPLFSDINNILRKVIGIDKIIEHIIGKIGTLEAAYLVGKLAEGKESDQIELALVGNNIDSNYIDSLILKAKEFISRKIEYSLLAEQEMKTKYTGKPVLLIWDSKA
jgi:hypothetical protein